MFLQKNRFKASTLCASSALLVLGGFMSVNLAGCGGGGGGGGTGFGTPTATAGPQAITFRLVRQNLAASNGGTVTLTSANNTTFSATANAAGIASIANVPAGTYAVVFTVQDNEGAVISTTNSTVIITRESGQTFLLLQDQGAGATTSSRVSGTIRLNPGATPAPTATATATATGTPAATAEGTPTATATATATPDPFQFSACTTISDFVTDALLVEAIDLDTSKGRPIIAQVRRSAAEANRGAYTISLPYRPATFQIRVSKSDLSGTAFAGVSAASNFNGVSEVGGIKAVTGLNICVNDNGTAPVIPPVVIFTATPTFTPTSIATSTPTSTPATTPATTPTTAQPPQ